MQANESTQHTLSVFYCFDFTWKPASKLWDVLYHGADKVCQVIPYNNEYHADFANPKKMYTVKAENYPGVGTVEQMVKGSDLLEYIESIQLGRR